MAKEQRWSVQITWLLLLDEGGLVLFWLRGKGSANVSALPASTLQIQPQSCRIVSSKHYSGQ